MVNLGTDYGKFIIKVARRVHAGQVLSILPFENGRGEEMLHPSIDGDGWHNVSATFVVLPRGGRLLASIRDPPPPQKWAEGPLGGGGGGGFREGRWGGGIGRVCWGGGVQVGQFGVVVVVGGGGGTGSRYLPLRSLWVRARVRVTKLVEPILVL